MRARQRGITFIGWVALLVPVAILLYAGIRLTPVYLNHLKVSRVLDQVATEARGSETVNAQSVRRSIASRFDVDMVSHPRPDQIAIVREGQKWFAEARYEDVTPLFGNVSLLVTFDKRVPLN
jgi:predicted lipid carrier protein YhbT